MKQLITFKKTLLLTAALILGGANSAWALELTETYDFAAFITANGTGNLTTSGDDISQTGTSAKVGTVKVITNLTANSKTLDLKGRFALDYAYNASSQIRFMWRSSSNNYQHGLAGQWNSKGTADAQGAARFSVLNLKAGDKITFTYYKQAGKAADPYTCRADMISAGGSSVAVDVALASGTQYTVSADGNVDLYFTNNNFAIASIVIVTTGTETVTTPSLELTGANNNSRKVTITAGESDAGNDVTTYYTIDGSTPTTSSSSFTTASKEITIGEGAVSESTITVKAISISSASTESTVGSQDFTVGTTIKLAKPSINLIGMGLAEGKYYKQYSFSADATGTYGSPTITCNATFGGNPISAPYTASSVGTISVIASADGYASSDAETLDVDAVAYILSRSYDFSQDIYRDGLSVVGNNITILSTGVQVYQINDVNHISGITLSGTGIFGFTKAQNYDTCKGLAPRWNKGSFTINNWIDGSFATLIDYVGNGVYASSSNGTFTFGSQVNNNTFTTLNIYTPTNAAVPVTIASSGYSTIASAYALDCANLPDGLTAYKVSAVTAVAVTLTEVNEAVEAGTGLILKGTVSTAYDIPVVATGTDISATNLLEAAVTATDIDADKAYILQGGLFHKVTAASTVPAGKAYLLASDVPTTARELTFVFEGEATGIQTVEDKTQNGEVYNLKGQRVAAPKKGLYIIGNKKVVIK